tara:strand:+ start:21435 stop:22301 length:867 start_codon:yes stop_codon:yes gene_type:complete
MIKESGISVIISTYNSEKWLEKVLWSYQAQDFKNFELVIADDGSDKATEDLINYIKLFVDYEIIHIWQKDEGFQKSRILNKAIMACNFDYILMSDGDCIVRKDFLSAHAKKRKKGFFLSGGYYKLPLTISKAISNEDILQQSCFNIKWLRSKGLKSSFKNNKITAKTFKSEFLNNVTPTKASWNGHNSSGWKKDILAVNGFDERMQYGGQDRELGERLANLGIKSKQIRYSAICLHLDHPRGYCNQKSIDKNKSIRKETRKTKKTYTVFGIKKHDNNSIFKKEKKEHA